MINRNKIKEMSNEEIDKLWLSKERNMILLQVEKEGDAELMLSILNRIKPVSRANMFNGDQKELAYIITSLMNISGQHKNAAESIKTYFKTHKINTDVFKDEYIALLSVELLKCEIYYTPVNNVLLKATELERKMGYLNTSDVPRAYATLLLFIGSLYHMLNDEGNFKRYLDLAEHFVNVSNNKEVKKMYLRLMADYRIMRNDYDEAFKCLNEAMPERKILDRHDAESLSSLAKIYMVNQNYQAAIETYSGVILYASQRKMSLVLANTIYGIAQAKFRLDDMQQAAYYTSKARQLYLTSKNEYGLCVTEALLSAIKQKCDDEKTKESIHTSFKAALRSANRMQYKYLIPVIEGLKKSRAKA